MKPRLCIAVLFLLCCLIVHAGAVVKIMPLGDSITRGGPDAGSTYPSYRYYLDESLRAAGYSVDFVGSTSSAYSRFVFDEQHEGHGGYTSGMMVGTSSSSPLAAWLAASPVPDVVLLHIGTNDARTGVPLTTRLQNVKAIVSLLRQKNPKVRVVVAQIIPTANGTFNQQSGLVAFNGALPALAAGLSTAVSPVTIADLFTGYNGVADNQGDGFHPATSGEKKMAAAWQRALAPILAGTTATPTTKSTTAPTTAASPAQLSGIPGTLEAEDYASGGEGLAYHDTTPTNLGGAYRNDGVDIEALDGGGYGVCYIRDGEWLRYVVSVASAGKYRAAFRVASWGAAAHAIEVQVNGNTVATVPVPITSDYHSWTEATTTLTLPAGTSILTFRFSGDGQNLDRVAFTPAGTVTTPTPTSTTVPPTTVATTAAPTPSGRPVPGTVEAEDYDAGGEGVGYHDTTAGNHDHVYRFDDVDLSVNPSGGYNIGYVVDGEWLAYTIAVPKAATYTIACSVASWANDRSLALSLDGISLGTLAVPNNQCNGWRTVSTTATLPAGSHRLVIRFVGDRQILDRITVAAVATPTTTKPTTAPTTIAPTATKPTTTPKPNAAPGTLEAEDYASGGEGLAYHDTTPTNLGGAYRNDGVDIEALDGGGYGVCYIRDGEWLRYVVPVSSAGTYRATFRVASWGATAHAIEVQVNGNTVATVPVPITSDYHSWAEATTTFPLPPGACILTLRFLGDGQNLDRISLSPVAPTPTSTTAPPTTVATTAAPTPSGRPVPGTVEAEDYDAGGEGVGYHDTTAGNHDHVYRFDDVDLSVNPSGGYNIGYVVDGEWLAYTIAVPKAATYTIACSVASWANDRSLALSLDGISLGTLAVPNNQCNGWRTVSTTATLPAGSHRLVIRFVGDRQILDRITVAAVATPTTTKPTTAPTTIAPTATKPTTTPKPNAAPGTLEAEDYASGGEGLAYHDTTPTNLGGAYRNDGVDIEALDGGGYGVCYIRNGEWLKYTVSVASAGKYRAAFRVASWGATAHAIEVQVNGKKVATVTVPATSDYHDWTEAATTLTLPAGTCTLTLKFTGDGQNLDRVVFTPAGTVTTPTTMPTSVPTTVAPGSTVLLPATIQAEDYLPGGEGVGYHDTTVGNQGGAYRSDGVDIAYATSIASHVVTQARSGEWLEYSINAPVERDYPLTFRLSSPSGGQFVEMEIDGRPEVTVVAPRTGSYDSYTWISTQVRLTKGVHRVRIQFYGDGQNFDAFAFS
jgi:lysophospholipase L1-like esterase